MSVKRGNEKLNTWDPAPVFTRRLRHRSDEDRTMNFSLKLSGPSDEVMRLARQVLSGDLRRVSYADASILAHNVVKYSQAVSRVEAFVDQLQARTRDRKKN